MHSTIVAIVIKLLQTLKCKQHKVLNLIFIAILRGWVEKYMEAKFFLFAN